jgi:hypothetical protein
VYFSAKEEGAPKKRYGRTLYGRTLFFYLPLALAIIICACYFFRALPQAFRMKTGNPIGFNQHETDAIPAESDSEPGTAEKSPVTLLPATKARLILESRNDYDLVKVVIEDPGNATYKYEWTINDVPAGTDDSIHGFKRGDKLSVKITPYSGKEYGQSRILTTEIKNSVPKVIENKEIKFDGKLLTYQVKAYDPDQDVLSYSLVEAPENMIIDKSSGVITWEIKKEDKGKRSFKVKISDGNGGEVIYGQDIDIDLLREGK